MRILIVDDHAIVRAGIRSILESMDKIKEVDEVKDASEALSKIRSNSYDFILLDLSLPGLGGLDIIKDIKQEQPKTPILVLSMYPEEQFAIRALKSGASGYLNKQAAAEKLPEAIKTVMSGEYFVSPLIANELVRTLQGDSEKQPHELLTDREFEVMLLLASGLETNEIAKKLYLSDKTISAHRIRILKKMGMKNSVELAIYAVKNKLI